MQKSPARGLQVPRNNREWQRKSFLPDQAVGSDWHNQRIEFQT